MKKLTKILLVALMIFGVVINFDLFNVKAETNTAPEVIYVRSRPKMYHFSREEGTAYISGYEFYFKKLVDGTVVYCMSGIDLSVPAGQELHLKGEVEDKGLSFLLQNSYPNKSFTGDEKKDYYISQAAIWKYLDETTGSKNWNGVTFSSSSGTIKSYVYKLVQKALAAKNNPETVIEPSLSVNIPSSKMTLSSDSKYFVSDLILINAKNTESNYKVNLVNAPNGTLLKNINGLVKTEFQTNEGFMVYVPVTSLKDSISGTVNLEVSVDAVSAKTYIYEDNNPKHQDVSPAVVYNDIDTLKENLSLTYHKEEEVVTKVKISKQDITTKKELAGATLIIKDKNGKIVDEWVSTTTPHYIEGLEPGEYTLTEKIAPKGYVLSEETIKFTVKADGTLTSVVMNNEKEEEIVTKVKISKQDITTKKEVAGAKLTVKDKNGKIVDEWVSTDTPHYIVGLDVGKYTLSETIAPEGYILSQETIEFEVKADGTVTNVVMYNDPVVTKVKISKQDITTKKELSGATLVVKDKNGKIVDEWVSTDTPHYIEGLKPGEYTLTEKIAPEGYILSQETIKFEVKKDGTTTNVTMYNTSNPKVTITKISKQDITTKKELSGATLVIKDKNDKIIDEWVSTDTPHYIEGLKPGKYTLTETMAPEGYALTSESVEFTVKDDGTVSEVVMYNALVPITDLNINQASIIFSVILIMIGTGVVFYYAKFQQ